eukprot:6963312-Ditylum_brightwellii.AAC.1
MSSHMPSYNDYSPTNRTFCWLARIITPYATPSLPSQLDQQKNKTSKQSHEAGDGACTILRMCNCLIEDCDAVHCGKMHWWN